MLAGRVADVGAVLDVLDRLRGGHGASLAVVGEPGIGKTALLEHALRRCDGLRVLHVTGHEGESRLPFSGLLTLFRPVLDLLPSVTPPARAALGQALGLRAGPPPTPFAVAGATLELLAAAAEAGPVLVAVDDLHVVDEPSSAGLLFALRRLHDERVGAVLTARPGERVLGLLDGVPVRVLRGLGVPDGARLLQERGLAAEVVEALVGFTGGNPLALREMAAVLDADQRAGRRPVDGALRTGADVVERFVHHLAALPASTRDLVLVLAVEPSVGAALLEATAEALDLPVDAHVPALRAGLLTAGPDGLRLATPCSARRRWSPPPVRAATRPTAPWPASWARAGTGSCGPGTWRPRPPVRTPGCPPRSRPPGARPWPGATSPWRRGSSDGPGTWRPGRRTRTG